MNQHKTQISLSKRIKYACAWMAIPCIRRAMRSLLKDLLSKQKTLQENIETTRQENINYKADVSSKLESLDIKISKIEEQSSKHFNSLESKVLYTNTGEQTFINNFFDDYNPKDERILSLLRGLDNESAHTIVKIIKRIGLIKNNTLPLDLYTQDEQNNIKTNLCEYRAQVLSLDNDVHVYQNKFLPMHRFFVSIFHNSFHGISKLSQHTINTINTGTIIDVGGFMGDSCLMFREFFPDSVMYSFECLPQNIQLFKKTIELNQLKNVHIVEKALSSEIGTSYFSTTLSSSHLSDKKEDGNIEVETDTLDAWLESNLLEKITMIKVDIEGAERKFLTGAKKSIEKHRPVLLLSIYHNWEDLLTIKPMLESWNLNYSFKVSIALDKNVLVDTMLVCEPLEKNSSTNLE